MNRKKGLRILALSGAISALVISGIYYPSEVSLKERGLAHTWSDCIANLRQIQGASEMWALENQLSPNAEVLITDISGISNRFIRGLINVDVKCQLGGTYSVTTVGENPRCSIPGHTL